MSNLKGIITKQSFDPDYFKESESYNVKTIEYKATNRFCVEHGACILTSTSTDVLVFTRFSKTEKEWTNFKVGIEQYISGNAEIVRLVPEVSEDTSSSTMNCD